MVFILGHQTGLLPVLILFIPEQDQQISSFLFEELDIRWCEIFYPIPGFALPEGAGFVWFYGLVENVYGKRAVHLEAETALSHIIQEV